MAATFLRRFRVTTEAVEAFARASGDRSPLHMDEAYARRTSFGQRVVHGALGVLHALAALPEPADGRVPVALQARFHAPLFIDQDYTVVSEPDTAGRVRVLDGARPLLDLELGYGAQPSGVLRPGDETPRRRETAAVRTLDDLVTGPLAAAFDPDEAAYAGLLDLIGATSAHVTVEFATLLGWVSYMVGMEAPGRRALAARYTVGLDARDPAQPCSARSELTAVDGRFGRVELSGRVIGPELTGTVEAEALIRDEPPAPELEHIRDRLGGDGAEFGGKVALVVGASRGLGAALVQALVLRGATVYGGFHRSREQAEALRTGLGEGASRLHLLQGDWADPHGCAAARARIMEEQGRLDLLVLSACPPVNALGLDTASADRAAAYVADSLALTQGPLVRFAEDVADARGWVLAVSSQWVTEPPAGRSHYVTAKLAVEGLMRGAAVEYPAASFLVARPPRLATSLSGGIVGQSAGAPVEPVAAALVRRVLDAAEQGGVHLMETFDLPVAPEGDRGERTGAGNTHTADTLPPPATGATPPRQNPVEEDGDGTRPALVTAATFTADPLLPALAHWNERLGLGLRLELAPYGQVFQELLDPASSFHRNTRGCNAVLLRLDDWPAGTDELHRTAADFVSAVATYAQRGGAPLIVHLCPSEPDVTPARRRVLDEAREVLTRGLAELRGIHLTDGVRWGDGFEVTDYHDAARLGHARIPYTDIACTALGTALMRTAHSLLAPPFKVLVLDCDNTLWGGVCGEDGPEGVTFEEAHLEVQRWALGLRERGVLLCLASKNDEDGVAEVFRRRADDMPLRREHLAAWKVNWEPKASNIVALARDLGLGLDSFVLLDDNPVEIAAVRAACPQVLALTFPADRPDAVPGMLQRVWAFDRPEVTAEDRGRADDYAARRRREEARAASLTFADFIEGLGLRVDVRAATEADLPRVAQMTQRTNQFNFSTIRRTEPELRSLLTDEQAGVRCWVTEVSDRFGDYGIVGAALTRRAPGDDTVVLDSFLMSCRVLGRGVEHTLLSRLGVAARDDGARFLEAVYRPTAKNEPARACLESVAAEYATAQDDGSVTYRMPVDHTAAIAFRPENMTFQEPSGHGRDPLDLTVDPLRLAALAELAERETDAAGLHDRVRGAGVAPGLPVGAVNFADGRSVPSPSAVTALDSVRILVQEVFSRTLAHPHVPADASFEALRLTSLDIVNLTVALEKRLRRELPTTLLFEHRDLGGLARALAGVPHEVTSREEDAVDCGEPAPSPRPLAVYVPPRAPANEPVAVVGLAGRYPGASTVDDLWDMLAEGRCAVRELATERWDHSRHLDPDGGPETTYSAWAALLEDVDRFDAQFFGIAPREAETMDPQQRLFLEVAHEAVQDAGHTRGSLGPDVGVYVGVMANDYAALSRSAALTGDSPFPYAENYQIANRVSYSFDFSGPSLAVDTACSASAVALHLACQAIHRGEVDAAIAGGVNLVLHPARHIQYAQMGMLSRTGLCRPFGEHADGFVIGEGVGAVLLKPLSRARADGDHVHGVIKGSWTNSGGRTSGFTVPNPHAQAALVGRALAAADVDSRTISYLEAHGSGTELGDPIEIRGLTEAFGPRTDDDGWCAIGSVKSAIGHLEPAAGIAGLTKVLLQLRHRRLVPTLHAETLNPRIDFHRTPFRVQRELSDWHHPAGPGGPVPLRAGISSFGAGGVNAHLVVEEAPWAAVAPAAPERPELIVVGAADATRLRTYARRLHAYMTAGAGREARVADIAHTLRIGREPLAHRAAFVVRDRAELGERLAALAEERTGAGIVYGRPDDGSSLADVFTDSHETARFMEQLAAAGDLLRIGRMWTRGAPVAWDALFRPAGFVRVPLPPHPFRPTRYWLQGAERPARATEAPVRPATADAFTEHAEPAWYLRAGWRDAADPLDSDGIDPAHGPVVVALTGGTWRPADPAVGIACTEDEVLRRVAGADPARGAIVLDGRRLDRDALAEDPMRLPLALARARATDVTYAGLYLPEADDPMGACVTAFTRSAEQEIPGFRGVRIEVGGDGEAPDAARLVKVLGKGVPELRLVRGRCQERVLEPLAVPDAPVAPWRERGVYLVTGGAGGVGRIIAERLARTHRADLILLGRGPARPDVDQCLDGIRELGGRAWYVSADVCDRAALTTAIAEGERRFGPLNGVIHAAGIVEDTPLRAKSDASIARVLAAKTTGTRLLDEVTADRELDFFCLMSSVNGTLGNAGQADYAAANRYLDAFALSRDAQVTSGQRHGLSVSVAWPHWSGGGMSAPPAALALAESVTGLRAMNTATGLRALDAVLAGEPGCTVVGVGDRRRCVAAFAGTSTNLRTPGDGGQGTDATTESLADQLIDLAARVLKTPRAEIEVDVEFGRYGFNSVLLTDLCQQINTTYGTALTPVVFFEHPTLTKLTAALAQHETVRRTLADRTARVRSAVSPPTASTTEAPLVAVQAGNTTALPGERPEPVAIVGLAGRFPDAPDLDTYWAHLVAGHDAVREVPPERWDWRTAAAGEYCRYGGFLDDVDAFDADFFGISAREARTMDPQQRLFLETSWSAVEHAGHDPRSLTGSRTGVFAGVTLHDWLDVLRRHGEQPAAHTVSGNVHSIVPNRVSHLLDLRGPSEALDTACSSSLAALHRAVGALRSGECDMALAGGVNVLLATDVYDSLSQAGMLSPTGHCHAFGDAADGYVRGEGVGVVVLKRLSRALTDGDTVHAVILGTAVGHGGRGHSLTAPNPSAQADVVAQAVRAAGVPAGSISFVETHGTGTPLGDPIEASGLKEAFALLGEADAGPGTCALGAVKSAIGHLESAAGIASLVKVVLAMRHRTLPPNLHCDPPNRHLDLTDSPFRLLDTAEPWKPPTGTDGSTPPLRAGVSSFGFGGSNAHVVLEEAPMTSTAPVEQCVAQAVPLSARDAQSLWEQARRLRANLSRPDGADLPALSDLAYTLQVGRTHLDSRVVLVAESVEELRDRLDRFLATGDGPGIWTGRVAAGTTGTAVPDPAPADAHALAASWAAGARIDWSAVHAGRPRRRVPLPTYPFDRTKRHGPTASPAYPPQDGPPAPRTSAPDSAPVRPTTTEPVDVTPLPHATGTGSAHHPVLVERRWTPLQGAPQPSRRRFTCLLVVRGHESLGLIGGLDAGEPGIDWIVLRERSGLPRLLPREREYELDFDDYADGATAAAALLDHHPHIDTVLDLVDAGTPDDHGTDEEESGLGREAGRVALLQVLVRHTNHSDLHVVHVTRGLAPYRNRRSGLTGARMAALVRTLGSEYSAVRATTLDLDGETGLSDALSLAVREVETAGEEPEVCLRSGVRYAPRLADLDLRPEDYPSPGTFGGFTVDPDRVYVITGGTGGLGAALARELFVRGARRFALLGRRPLPPVATWVADDSGPAVPNGSRDVVALRDRGARIELYGGPLTDRTGLGSFLDRVRATLGPIAGVVHCAGSVDQRNPAFIRKTWADIARTWEPKGEGLVTLDRLLAADEPDFVVLYSSLSGTLPFLATGLADYGSANAYLDAFATRAAQRASRTRYLSIAWGGWAEIGMGEVRSPRYTEQGFTSLAPAEGMALLDAALRHRTAPTVIALARDGDTVTGHAPTGSPASDKTAQGTDGIPAELLTLVIDAVRDLIAEEVLVPRESVTPDTGFAELGVDSVLLAGLVTRLEALTGAPVSPSAVLEYPSAGRLAAHLMREYPSGVRAWAADQVPSPDGSRAAPDRNTAVPGDRAEIHPSEAAPARSTPGTTPGCGPVAVIGMASRFPGAPTTDAYWELLRTGRDAITEVPATRWDTSRLYAAQHTPGRSTSKWGGFIDGIEEFDPGFFGIADADAEHVDPVIRLVLECAEETFRDAGYGRSELSGRRVGVFAGAGASTYGTRIPVPRRATVTGLNPNFIGAHIAHIYDFSGPNMVVDTACSTSLTALYLARQALALGECDMALVAGADLLLDEAPYLKLSAAEALSPRGRCRVFDQDADGFVPGEGAGAVLLKRLDAAVADGDRIHAVLESVAMNNDGRTMGLTTPNPAAQESVVLAALLAAGADPASVGYVEAHGTGTMIGDPMELRALTRAFRSGTDESGFCAIGSVKSVVGHLLMASGMAGLHKVVLALRHRWLPPTLHCSTPNPRFSFDTSPFYPITEPRDWEPRAGVRRAGLSSFGFGGTNCHAILREPLADELRTPTRTPLPPAPFRRTRHWVDQVAVPATAPPPSGRRYLELLADEPVAVPSLSVPRAPDATTAPEHRPYLQLEELS
ncbi:SDR family NAD(P)-dependent oxidoreductase [Streptomyces tauricus]|uniref:SDR family NAD(P)-dependent oxidoreductase n=1 Tax=Streptomyces tauricus TaxID=68274 RepID=UPI0033A8B2E5